LDLGDHSHSPYHPAGQSYDEHRDSIELTHSTRLAYAALQTTFRRQKLHAQHQYEAAVDLGQAGGYAYDQYVTARSSLRANYTRDLEATYEKFTQECGVLHESARDQLDQQLLAD